ncbi:centrosomal protein POC5-like isoform X2 [Myxocyprinus asiaticus]|uniref:centrosomal protein POC5-like isoform X2 n=1 Tax=Myxocyprinus asiaticus TaxID=70543 RepID=UPI0022221D08|nr:centrosomal protein POC5-like isoform X2 [Myxocyprinus asiaticus]
MSSDEGESSSPVLPRDSDRGSSVSSELQDEYEELLRNAVVTPKCVPSHPSQLLSTTQLSRSSQHSTKMDTAAQPPADNEAHSNTEVTLTRETPSLEKSRPPSCISEGESIAARSVASEERSERAQTRSDRSRQSSPDGLITVMTEMFISEENLNKMENILDIWSTNIKSNVMMELRKWKLAFVEQHRLELKKEREKHAAQMAAVNAEMDRFKDLLNTYEISNQRKDEVIMNLSRAVDRQREKLELMRSFTQWRLKHCAAREEGSRMAEQHYHLQLKRKVWAGWHSLIQNRWRERVERACCARAEDVCIQLSADYEAKMAQHVEELQRAQSEIQRLHRERERYEDSMKKAFMRGVCALNIEALSMFNTAEAGRLDRDAPYPGDEPSTSSLANHPPRTVSSARLSPIVMETPIQLAPSHSYTEDAEEQFVSQSGSSTVPRKETVLSTTVVNTTVPTGGSTTSMRHVLPDVNTQIVTAGKQKASKTVTARLTGRAEPHRVGRPPGTLHVMGVAPPMSSVIVERHHPVTQLTVGQATAAKFPHSALQSQTVSSSKSSFRQPRGPSSSTFDIHSIKVVD